jgi:hypothetical protein
MTSFCVVYGATTNMRAISLDGILESHLKIAKYSKKVTGVKKMLVSWISLLKHIFVYSIMIN